MAAGTSMDGAMMCDIVSGNHVFIMMRQNRVAVES
jgi:hypothetical protein